MFPDRNKKFPMNWICLFETCRYTETVFVSVRSVTGSRRATCWKIRTWPARPKESSTWRWMSSTTLWVCGRDAVHLSRAGSNLGHLHKFPFHATFLLRYIYLTALLTYGSPERQPRKKQNSVDPFSKPDLNSFLCCVYVLKTGEKKIFCQDNLSKFLNFFFRLWNRWKNVLPGRKNVFLSGSSVCCCNTPSGHKRLKCTTASCSKWD